MFPILFWGNWACTLSVYKALFFSAHENLRIRLTGRCSSRYIRNLMLEIFMLRQSLCKILIMGREIDIVLWTSSSCIPVKRDTHTLNLFIPATCLCILNFYGDIPLYNRYRCLSSCLWTRNWPRVIEGCEMYWKWVLSSELQPQWECLLLFTL